MKKEVLIDSGPLIALFNSGDKYHNKVLKFLKKFSGKLITTWPVITEVIYMLSFSVDVQNDFLEWIERGSLDIMDLKIADIRYIRTRMKKYSDIPMDLADASLMCISETKSILNIISIDSDFEIYRTLDGKYLKNVLNG